MVKRFDGAKVQIISQTTKEITLFNTNLTYTHSFQSFLEVT